MGAIIQWLFTDPQTAGGTGPGGSELFHFYLAWIIFCGAGILIPFYYWVEGRKRFFKKNVLNKRLMDKYMNKLVLIALVGWPIMGARDFLDNSPLAWRVWRYAWLVWLAVVAFRLLFYLIAKYPEERRDYLRNERLLQYFPKPNLAKRQAKTAKR